MTYYITSPMSRLMHRRMWDLVDNNIPSMESEISFPVDVKADADAFVIEALLPGIEAEDLNIQVVNGTVSIQGTVKREGTDDETYLLRELPGGKFCRTLTLPDPLDASKAEATMRDGVLHLRVPKAEEARPKSIKITSK